MHFIYISSLFFATVCANGFVAQRKLLYAVCFVGHSEATDTTKIEQIQMKKKTIPMYTEKMFFWEWDSLKKKKSLILYAARQMHSVVRILNLPCLGVSVYFTLSSHYAVHNMHMILFFVFRFICIYLFISAKKEPSSRIILVEFITWNTIELDFVCENVFRHCFNQLKWNTFAAENISSCYYWYYVRGRLESSL